MTVLKALLALAIVGSLLFISWIWLIAGSWMNNFEPNWYPNQHTDRPARLHYPSSPPVTVDPITIQEDKSTGSKPTTGHPEVDNNVYTGDQ